MSIASRITSIEEHLKESYQELEGIGIDTTGVNNNLENIPKLLDGYWETLPKVTDEGTSITLDNTKEGKMKVLLKGNTEQTQYTGVQVFDKSLVDTTNPKLAVLDTGIKLVNAWANDITSTTNVANLLKPNTTYTLRTIARITARPSTFDENQRTMLLYRSSPSFNTILVEIPNVQTASLNTDIEVVRTFTTPDDVTGLRMLGYTFHSSGAGNGTIELKDFMIVEGTYTSETFPSYQPYVGNQPSPNPDYPQDIHTVSGDNTIEVVGKNLFSGWTKGKGVNSQVGSIVDNTDGAISNYIKVDFNEHSNYYVSGLATTISAFVAGYNKNKEFIGRTGRSATTNIGLNSTKFSNGTPQGTGNVEYIIIYQYKQVSDSGSINDIDNLQTQVEIGSTATTYEPYVSSSYQVNLGVENLFNINGNINTQYNGTAITSNSVVDGNLVTTTNGGSFHPGGQKIYVGAGNTVTASMIFKDIAYSTQPSSDTIVAYTGFYNDNTITGRNLMNLRQNLIGTKITITFTPTTDYVYLVFARSSVVTSATFGEIQLEVGDKANTYNPYGTSPIELCKIGTYQDRFIRNSGKNLFDKNSTLENGYIDINGTATVSNNYKTTDYIPIKPNTSYVTGNMTNSGSNPSRCYYDENKTFISGAKHFGATDVIGTSPSNARYMKESIPVVDIDRVQIEEGSTATDYEPYGTGDWYLKKETGKVVLDGTTDGLKFTSAEISRNKRFSLILNDVLKQNYSLNIDNKSNYFTYNTDVYRDGGDEIGFIINSTQLYVRFGSSSVLDTITKANAWLSTHNTTFYYILATPTYTKIEGTLASQLEALNGSKSYTPQTNISQNNNDMASVLNATALSNGTVTPSLQSVQTLSLGQNVDLQSQEPIEEQEEEVEEQGEEL